MTCCVALVVQASEHHKQLLQEQAQRERRGEISQPRWFKRVEGDAKIGVQYLFEYTGSYWGARATGFT